MKIYINRAIISFLIVLSFFLMFFIVDKETFFLNVCFCVISLLMVFSYFNNVVRNTSFFVFVISYFIAELLNVLFHNSLSGLLYVVINSMYCLAYLSLLVFVVRAINFKEIWQRFKGVLIVLAIFSGIVVFNMNDIMLGSKTIEVSSYKFVLDTLYNVVVVLLLCLSFLNFMYNDTKMSLLLFLICLSLVFYEVTQLAYIYVAKYYTLFVLFSAFKLTGFFVCFCFLHVKKNILYGILS